MERRLARREPTKPAMLKNVQVSCATRVSEFSEITFTMGPRSMERL